MSRYTGPSVRVRATVLERDLDCCVRCGRYIGYSGYYSLQHRVPRGMGGSKDPRLNLPSNLLTLCGSATTGCHEHVESHRVDAMVQGYVVRRTEDPTRVPVLTWQGWRFYDNEGTTTEGAPA